MFSTDPLVCLMCSRIHGSSPASLLPKFKRSPSRRSKSRWEPLPEEKPVDKPAYVNNGAVKYAGWAHANERDRKVYLLYFFGDFFSLLYFFFWSLGAYNRNDVTCYLFPLFRFYNFAQFLSFSFGKEERGKEVVLGRVFEGLFWTDSPVLNMVRPT